MKIQGQAALVTGGASGLGEATARELARLGAKVAVLDVNLGDACCHDPQSESEDCDREQIVAGQSKGVLPSIKTELGALVE